MLIQLFHWNELIHVKPLISEVFCCFFHMKLPKFHMKVICSKKYYQRIILLLWHHNYEMYHYCKNRWRGIIINYQKYVCNFLKSQGKITETWLLSKLLHREKCTIIMLKYMRNMCNKILKTVKWKSKN